MRLLLRNLLLIAVIIMAPVLIHAGLDENISSFNDNVIRIRSVKEYDKLDYLFIGSSHTYSSVDPKLFDSIGVRTYNLGVASSGVLFYKLLIDDYLKNTGTLPGNIVLSVTPYTFSIKSDNFSIYPIHEYLNTRVSNEELLRLTHNVKVYSSNWFEKVKKVNLYHRSTILAGNNQDAEARVERNRINKGHVPSLESFSKKKYLEEMPLYEPLLQSEFLDDKLNLLFSLISDLKKKGINVIIHEEPTFRLRDFFSNEYLTAYEQLFHRISSLQIQTIRCKLPFDSTCFRNVDHMNSKGASAYTRFLIGELNIDQRP